MSEDKMTTAQSIDNDVKLLRSSGKNVTNPKHPESIKINYPHEVVEKIMEGQGVSKESLRNMGSATTHFYRVLHHAASDEMRENILEHRDNKEFLEKLSVTGKADIVPRHIRATVKVNGERRGNTIPSEGRPSVEYVKYGSSTSIMEVTTSLNEQREADSKLIEEAYKEARKK